MEKLTFQLGNQQDIFFLPNLEQMNFIHKPHESRFFYDTYWYTTLFFQFTDLISVWLLCMFFSLRVTMQYIQLVHAERGGSFPLS